MNTILSMPLTFFLMLFCFLRDILEQLEPFVCVWMAETHVCSWAHNHNSEADSQSYRVSLAYSPCLVFYPWRLLFFTFSSCLCLQKFFLYFSAGHLAPPCPDRNHQMGISLPFLYQETCLYLLLAGTWYSQEHPQFRAERTNARMLTVELVFFILKQSTVPSLRNGTAHSGQVFLHQLTQLP